MAADEWDERRFLGGRVAGVGIVELRSEMVIICSEDKMRVNEMSEEFPVKY